MLIKTEFNARRTNKLDNNIAKRFREYIHDY